MQLRCSSAGSSPNAPWRSLTQRDRAGETGVDYDATVTCRGCVSVQARGRDGSQFRTRCEYAITMQHLILRPGPRLVVRAFRPEPDETDGQLNEVDVTGRADSVAAVRAVRARAA